jgi:hypothetical protein
MIHFDPASFKDPAARVFYYDGWVYRSLSPEAETLFRSVDTTSLLACLERDGLILPSEVVATSTQGLGTDQIGPFLLKQPTVQLVSYSYEWSFEMLRDAALVTLRVLAQALTRGFTLKDGNSFNILFDGCAPKFVDLPSVERFREGDIWVGYGQFCRSFLFPLLMASYRAVDVRSLLRGRLGEIPAVDAAHFFTLWDVRKPGVLKDVLLQARLDRSFGGTPRTVRTATAAARVPATVLIASIDRLIRIVSDLRAPSHHSNWASYATTNSYSAPDRENKARFVRRALQRPDASRVVDLGSNTGEYSQIALESGAQVSALDIDSSAVDGLYRNAPLGARLSPLVADLLNPTPAMGWGLRERRSLFDRLHCERFLALGLVHHLRISGGVPLAQILSLLFDIAREGVIEWVDKTDEMVQQMLSLRPDVYDDYTWAEFERLVRERAEILAIEPIHDGTRRLCHVRQRESAQR